MGRVYDSIDNATERWLTKQPVFFVATAPSDLNGHLNLSPKGAAGATLIPVLPFQANRPLVSRSEPSSRDHGMSCPPFTSRI